MKKSYKVFSSSWKKTQQIKAAEAWRTGEYFIKKLPVQYLTFSKNSSIINI